MFLKNKSKKIEKISDKSFKYYPKFLQFLKPKEQIVFSSDYFVVDNNSYCSILSFFNPKSSNQNLGAFWGAYLIPTGLGDDVTVSLIQQFSKYNEKTVNEMLNRSERISEVDINQQFESGTNTTKTKSMRKNRDLEIIADEIQDGASYLNAHMRILVTSTSLKNLDLAISTIKRQYIERFATLEIAQYNGQQRFELGTLFSLNRFKLGKGFDFTSTELSGFYPFVTNGLEDSKGKYVGRMIGEINNSAILFDIDGYSHHVVIANNHTNEDEEKKRDLNSRKIDTTKILKISDIWGSKISQSCLINGGKVVHLVLNGANLDDLGPDLGTISSYVDLTRGEINMFEMFGNTKDVLSIFAAHVKKIILMFEQLHEGGKEDKTIFRGVLEEILTKFYVDQNMWMPNASENIKDLRAVGIPHKDVPLLSLFISHLKSAKKTALSSELRDDSYIKAVNTLNIVFQNMLSTHNDLFNCYTNSNIDNVSNSKRICYDFSNLEKRGQGIFMAQFINAIGFAVGNLGHNDSLIIHGCDYIDNNVKEYVLEQFDRLYKAGGRVVFLYDNIKNMIEDKNFNNFQSANYTILGSMTSDIISMYEDSLNRNIPADLSGLITEKADNKRICYIRRDMTNVVFYMDMKLGKEGIL